VTWIILLATSLLSLLVHPNPLPEVEECRLWLEGLLTSGDAVMLPEIADYELRRKLLHIGSQSSFRRLDALPARITYLPVTTEAWRKAADLWATGRRQGRKSAADEALDGDVILAA